MDEMNKVIDYLKAYCTYCLFDHCSLCVEFKAKHGVHRCNIVNPAEYAKYKSFIESKGYVMIDSSDKSLLDIYEADDEEDEDAGEVICCGQRTMLTSVGLHDIWNISVQQCEACLETYCFYCGDRLDYGHFPLPDEYEGEIFEGLCVKCWG